MCLAAALQRYPSRLHVAELQMNLYNTYETVSVAKQRRPWLAYANKTKYDYTMIPNDASWQAPRQMSQQLTASCAATL